MGDEIELTYEDAINGLGDSYPSSDEDDIYDAEPSEFKQPTNSRLALFEDDSSFRDGATKCTYEGSQSGQTIHQDQSSGCSVTIERLVWVDGWCGQPDKDGKDNAMTLVVLKLGFYPEEYDALVRYASVELKLIADTKDGEDPQLVAWGPFRRPEMWNVTDTHKRTSVTPSVQLSGGGAGQQVTVGVSGTKEMSWDERFSDYGLSSPKGDAKNSKTSGMSFFTKGKDKDKDKSRAFNAVLWQVFKNKLRKRGITPEIRVAALFERPQPSVNKNYRAVIKVTAHTSLIGQKAYRVMRRLGFERSDTIKWAVEARPGKIDHCYSEGLDIIKDIDLTRLGKLVDSKDRTNLDPEWLNKWDRVETVAPAAATATATATATTTATEPATATATATATTTDPTTASMAVAVAVTKPPETAPVTQTKDVEKQQTTGDSRKEAVQPATPHGPADALDYVQLESGNPGATKIRSYGERDEENDEESDDEDVDPGVNAPPPRSRLDKKQLSKIGTKRLVDLEKRAARAEERIAEQGQQILDLQQTLTRVAQALLVPSLNARRG